MRRRLAWGRRNRLPTVGAPPRARPGWRRPAWGVLRPAAAPGCAAAGCRSWACWRLRRAFVEFDVLRVDKPAALRHHIDLRQGA